MLANRTKLSNPSSWNELAGFETRHVAFSKGESENGGNGRPSNPPESARKKKSTQKEFTSALPGLYRAHLHNHPHSSVQNSKSESQEISHLSNKHLDHLQQ